MIKVSLCCLLAAGLAAAAANVVTSNSNAHHRRRRQDDNGDEADLPPLDPLPPPSLGNLPPLDPLPPLPPPSQEPPKRRPPVDKEAVDIANLDSLAKLVSSMPEFSTLATALTKAGLMATLAERGPYTLFAPTNEAFEKMAPATLERLMGNVRQLKAVLLRHLIKDNIEVRENTIDIS
jgi:hypothetical protein